MNVVCAVPIIRVNQNCKIALKSLFELEHRDVHYTLYFDHMRLVSSDDSQKWSEFQEFLFESLRWKLNQVTLVSGIRKLGLIGSWNTSAQLSWNNSQNPELFFWGSDHDVWSPNFLKFPIHVFSQPNPPNLAVPQCGDLEDGNATAVAAAKIGTGVNRFHGPYAPGYAIYGVFAFAGFPQLPNSLLPDRLFISKFSLRNVIVGESSPEIGYFRRRVKGEEFSLERQIRNLWGNQNHFNVTRKIPWWASHLISITSYFCFELFRNPNKRLLAWYKEMVIDRARRSTTLSRILVLHKKN